MYEQRIKEIFLEALDILMEGREMVIADCRAVRRKYAGYADRYAALESWMDGLKKEWEGNSARPFQRLPFGA
ncbi:hypothetical protein AALB64_01430 [Lachnospiraceae bacterium 45-P1]